MVFTMFIITDMIQVRIITNLVIIREISLNRKDLQASTLAGAPQLYQGSGPPSILLPLVLFKWPLTILIFGTKVLCIQICQ